RSSSRPRSSSSPRSPRRRSPPPRPSRPGRGRQGSRRRGAYDGGYREVADAGDDRPAPLLSSRPMKRAIALLLRGRSPGHLVAIAALAASIALTLTFTLYSSTLRALQPLLITLYAISASALIYA